MAFGAEGPAQKRSVDVRQRPDDANQREADLARARVRRLDRQRGKPRCRPTVLK